MGAAPRRLGVMGGTFDPIHTGHLLVASEARHTFGLDHVLFVPTGQPWQKADTEVSDPEDRYRMTLLATSDNPHFSVSRVDIERAGPTFTADTLTDLARLHPGSELFFITGADALNGILSWRRHEDVLRLAHLVGVTRPGHRLSAQGLPPGSATLLDTPAFAVSSTECRSRVRDGRPVDYLVPAAVADYIAKYDLYRRP